MTDASLFELEIWGDVAEKRHASSRADVSDILWDRLSDSDVPARWVNVARKHWTATAFQEYRTGCLAAAILDGMMRQRFPITLTSTFARFVSDEVSHAELASRVASAFGGGVPLHYTDDALVGQSTRLTTIDHVATALIPFAVGETWTTPLLSAAQRAATHEVIAAVLRIIVRDEADHGIIGWEALDWTLEHLDDDERRRLVEATDNTVRDTLKQIAHVQTQAPILVADAHQCGWLLADEYVPVAFKSLTERVVPQLKKRSLWSTTSADALATAMSSR